MLYIHAAYGQIKLETLIAFFVLVLGCALTTPKLRQISWASRMRDSYVFAFILTCTGKLMSRMLDPTLRMYITAVHGYLPRAISSDIGASVHVEKELV